MARQQHRFHGDPKRFEVLAAYVYARFGGDIRHIADVAGGQGMLARLLAKKYNYECDVIDPRGWTLRGVSSRAEEFDASMADYYDLIIGLHADQATRPVVEAAFVRPTILVPCCNFWSEKRLGQFELLESIEAHYAENAIPHERVVFPFRKPKNIGLVTAPPRL